MKFSGTIQVLRFLIVFLSTLKIFPIIQGHLKVFYNISYK